MDIWNSLTAVKGVREGEDWMKEGEALAKEHICITHRHRQWCGDGQREGEWGWVEVGKGAGKNGDICNSVDDKNKEKKFCYQKKVLLIIVVYLQI